MKTVTIGKKKFKIAISKGVLLNFEKMSKLRLCNLSLSKVSIDSLSILSYSALKFNNKLTKKEDYKWFLNLRTKDSIISQTIKEFVNFKRDS